MKKLLIISALAAVLASGCSTLGISDSTAFRVSSGSQVLEVKAGSTVSVELDSRLSTGFSWKLVYPLPDGVTLAGESIKTAEDGKTGGLDIQVFRLKVKKGEFILNFRYGEHWKSNPEYTDIRTVKIIAK